MQTTKFGNVLCYVDFLSFRSIIQFCQHLQLNLQINAVNLCKLYEHTISHWITHSHGNGKLFDILCVWGCERTTTCHGMRITQWRHTFMLIGIVLCSEKTIWTNTVWNSISCYLLDVYLLAGGLNAVKCSLCLWNNRVHTTECTAIVVMAMWSIIR